MANQAAAEGNCGTDWDLVVEGKAWAFHVSVAVWSQICHSSYPERGLSLPMVKPVVFSFVLCFMALYHFVSCFYVVFSVAL